MSTRSLRSKSPFRTLRIDCALTKTRQFISRHGETPIVIANAHKSTLKRHSDIANQRSNRTRLLSLRLPDGQSYILFHRLSPDMAQWRTRKASNGNKRQTGRLDSMPITQSALIAANNLCAMRESGQWQPQSPIHIHTARNDIYGSILKPFR